MCGIAGIITDKNYESADSSTDKMIQALHHRGPDGSGKAVIDLQSFRVFLGHTRLSILDLSENASQPMHDSKTNSWLIYNGEIYNFKILREELKRRGEEFKSTGDTEVLLKALLVWGKEAVHKLSGMFAFAFWDGRKKELLLARDQFGIKPLYYYQSEKSFIFSSEVKAILNSQLEGLSIDPEGLKSYLIYGAVISPNTIIKGIKELPPGGMLRIASYRTEAKPERYIDLAGMEGEHLKSSSFKNEAERIKFKLRESITSQLVSDVPLGIFLSGGIDSSLLTVLASEELPDIHLYTVGFPEEEYSELEYASFIARKVRGFHHIISLTPKDLKEQIPRAIQGMDQPTVDGVNTFIISNFTAKQGVKVLLSGLGGDELFAGYTTFRNIPLLLRRKRLMNLIAKITFYGKDAAYRKLGLTTKLNEVTKIYLLHRCIRWNQDNDILARELMPPNDFGLDPSYFESLSSLNSGNDYKSISLLELQFYMSNQLLRDSDVFSMANSIELRVPYIDLNILKSAHSLPFEYHVDLYKPSGRKLILKEILRHTAPEMNLNRRKMGFTLPWEKWLKNEFKEELSDLFANSNALSRMGIDKNKFDNIYLRFRKNDPLVTWFQIWSVFVLMKWQERFGVSL